jgi:hypothetical protein
MQDHPQREARRRTGATRLFTWSTLWRAVALAGTAWLCSAMAEMPAPADPTTAVAPR